MGLALGNQSADSRGGLRGRGRSRAKASSWTCPKALGRTSRPEIQAMLQGGQMASRRMGRVAVCIVAPLLAVGAVVAGQAGAASASTGGIPSQLPLFVSPDANPSDAGQSCDSATFTTIQSAVNA